MASYLCRAEDCPPDDKPWLVSSRRQLEEDARIGAELEAEDNMRASSGTHTVPTDGSYRSIVRWASTVENKFSCANISRIVLDAAPEAIELQLLIQRGRIERIMRFWEPRDEAAFLSSPHRRQDAPASALETIESFKAWLLNHGEAGTKVAAKAAASSQEDAPKENESLQAAAPHADTSPNAALPGGLAGLTLVASVVCTKGDAMRPTADRLMRSLGMPGAAFVSPRSLGLVDVPSSAHSENMLKGVVGDKLSFRPSTASAQAAVPLVLLFNERVSPFVQQLDEQARTGGKAYFLVRRATAPPSAPTNAASSTAAVSTVAGSEGETSNATSEESATTHTHHVLWLSGAFAAEEARVSAHCVRGEGEADDIVERFEKCDSDGDYLRLCLLNRELEAAKGARAGTARGARPMKLATTLAITACMHNHGGVSWMNRLHPSEFGSLVGFLDDLASYWRTILLKQTNADLGLGLTDSEADRASSREALETYLRAVATSLAKLDERLAFPAIAATTRVRKRKGESDESVAARRACMQAAKAGP